MRFISLLPFLAYAALALPQNVVPTGDLLGSSNSSPAKNESVSISGARTVGSEPEEKTVGVGAKVFGWWRVFVKQECLDDDVCFSKGVAALNKGERAAKRLKDVTSIASSAKATKTSGKKVSKTSSAKAEATTSVRKNNAAALHGAARKPHSKTRRPLRPTSTTISSSELPQPTITSSSKVEEPTSVAKTTTSKEDPPSSSAEAEPTTSREEDPSTTSKSAPTPSAEPEEPSTSSSSTPKSAPTSGSGLSGLSAFAKEALKGHNDFRAQYGAEALSWSDELEAAAQKWTDRCVFEHGGGVALGAGENIAAGQNSISSAIKNWGPDEAADYNPNAVEASHFTQMVWKATTQVGCAVTQCDSLAIFGGGAGALYACEYLTAGNVFPAENFLKNVGSFQG